MPERRKWARGANQYVQRLGAEATAKYDTDIHLPVSEAAEEQRTLTGINWDITSIDLNLIELSTVERARQRFRASLTDLIWNAAALEGNTFTLPEVRTLLDGVTIGGRKVEEERQVLALSEGYSYVDEVVGTARFRLDRTTSNHVHSLVAVHEAIESGHFRGQGTVTGGGTVNLSTGGTVHGREHGENGESLVNDFENLGAYLNTLPDPRERALAYFAAAAREQFYFDGNKRTARLMMTGELMSHGYEAVSVPYARRLEYNQALDRLFTDDDGTLLMAFLATCTIG